MASIINIPEVLYPGIDLHHLDADLVKSGVDVVYASIFAIILALLWRVGSGQPPFWYPILEKLLGVGFLIMAFSLVYVLPITLTAIKFYLGYYFFQILLFYILPGPVYEGLPVAEEGGKSRKYKCNGLLAFVVTLALFFYGDYAKWWSATIAYDHFGAILNVANIWGILVAVLLYVKGKFAPTIRSNPEESWAYDVWYGLELNPEIFGFDIKFWTESRPGLIAWVLIDFSFAAAQYKQFGVLSLPMILVCLMHFLYVIDCFIVEPLLVSTWDIAFEKFGFMLVWGCNVWIPFFYSIQTWFLVDYPGTEISYLHAAECIFIFIVGYAIFRGSNRQKHLFKSWIKGGKKDNEPNGGGFFFNAEPEVVRTSTGGQLLVSGWWGLARHMNYLGDLLLSLAWSLPCGMMFGIYPYTHLLFMIGLLLHRFARDDEACARKYGEDWDTYCERVPYKLIPGIF